MEERQVEEALEPRLGCLSDRRPKDGTPVGCLWSQGVSLETMLHGSGQDWKAFIGFRY